MTLLATFNAVGDYAPLMFILKGKRLKAEWCVGAPVDSIVVYPMMDTSELFVEFGKKFVSSLPENDTLPYILLLDGHRTRCADICSPDRTNAYRTIAHWTNAHTTK